MTDRLWIQTGNIHWLFDRTEATYCGVAAITQTVLQRIKSLQDSMVRRHSTSVQTKLSSCILVKKRNFFMSHTISGFCTDFQHVTLHAGVLPALKRHAYVSKQPTSCVPYESLTTRFMAWCSGMIALRPTVITTARTVIGDWCVVRQTECLTQDVRMIARSVLHVTRSVVHVTRSVSLTLDQSGPVHRMGDVLITARNTFTIHITKCFRIYESRFLR